MFFLFPFFLVVTLHMFSNLFSSVMQITISIIFQSLIPITLVLFSAHSNYNIYSLNIFKNHPYYLYYFLYCFHYLFFIISITNFIISNFFPRFLLDGSINVFFCLYYKSCFLMVCIVIILFISILMFQYLLIDTACVLLCLAGLVAANGRILLWCFKLIRDAQF